MKTTHRLFEKLTADTFMPAKGIWTADFDSETQDCFGAIPALEGAIEKEVGFPVVVKIFHSNGHEINDNSNEVHGGAMVVT